MREEDGTIAKSSKRPFILADYFEKKQWGDVKKPDMVSTAWPQQVLIQDYLNISINEFSDEELVHVWRKTKNNKSPGNDGIPIEFYKWLDADNRRAVLAILNQCWNDKTIPRELELANVVTLYKKGAVEDPANYRPISLLQSLYNLLASLIQVRLANGIDAKLSDLQYGFRKGKSTSNALFIARRLQDIAESSKEPLILMLLDWEKAFDKVYHDELLGALRRMNVPDDMINMIVALYKEPKFAIPDREGKSD